MDWHGPAEARLLGVSLFLDHDARTREDVCWETLLPGDEVTGWLGVDLEGLRLRITPGRAVAA